MGAAPLLAHATAATPWEWHAHPDVWLLVAALVVSYVVAVRVVGPRAVTEGEPVVTRRNVWCFGGGVATIWLFSDWPVHEISEGFLLSVHMVQHLMFTLIAPPLLLLGTPTWLARKLLPKPVLGPVRWLSKPLVAGILFNVITVATHVPAVVDASLRTAFVHFAVHTVLVLTALLMWMPALSPLPEIRRITYPGRMVHLFLQSVVPTVPASFFTFAETPIYEFYARAPRIWGMSAIEDQQAAGAVMKIGGGSVLWGAIILLFFRWYALEQKAKREGVLTWDDVLREFERTPPAAEQVR